MPQTLPITVSITRAVRPKHHRRINIWVQGGAVGAITTIAVSVTGEVFT